MHMQNSSSISRDFSTKMVILCWVQTCYCILVPFWDCNSCVLKITKSFSRHICCRQTANKIENKNASPGKIMLFIAILFCLLCIGLIKLQGKYQHANLQYQMENIEKVNIWPKKFYWLCTTHQYWNLFLYTLTLILKRDPAYTLHWPEM